MPLSAACRALWTRVPGNPGYLDTVTRCAVSVLVPEPCQVALRLSTKTCIGSRLSLTSPDFGHQRQTSVITAAVPYRVTSRPAEITGLESFRPVDLGCCQKPDSCCCTVQVQTADDSIACPITPSQRNRRYTVREGPADILRWWHIWHLADLYLGLCSYLPSRAVLSPAALRP